MNKTEHQEILDALNAPFDPAASRIEIVSGRGTVSIVHSTRLPEEYSKALEDEADRRGVTPSKLMQILIVAGLEEARGNDVVHIPRQRLLEVLEQAVNQAA